MLQQDSRRGAELVTDGTTYWINNAYQCLGRFSRKGWCIWSEGYSPYPSQNQDDGVMVEVITRSKADSGEMTDMDWKSFVDDMEILYGLGGLLGGPPWQRGKSVGARQVRNLDTRFRKEP